MSFLLDRHGKVSTIRVALLIAVIGFIFLGGGYLAFTLDQSSRRVPLDIPLPANAEYFGLREKSIASKDLFYRVPGGDQTDQIMGYYQTKLDEMFGVDPNTREFCKRNPEIGTFDGYQPGTQQIPYYWTCNFDRSQFNMTQTTIVKIHPGVIDTNPALSTEGMTVIVYEQKWTP